MRHETLAETPWWLEAGEETCPFCQRHYHYEAGYHCVRCDRPICPLCVVVLQRHQEVRCPECGEESGEEDAP